MRKSNIVKLLILTLMCISFTTPAYAEFDFSEDIIIAGVETAGVGGATGETYKACNTSKCNELKESLKVIDQGLIIYNKELVRLINQFTDPEIVDMMKQAQKKKEALSKADDKTNMNCEKEEYSKLLMQIIDKASLNSSQITQIKNILALQVDMKKNIIDQLKESMDFNEIKQQGLELQGGEDE